MSDMFGRYELRGLLGRGGMGEVFRAYDTIRQREVALKLLPSHLAGDESFEQRFRRESQIAARLSAPHVIPIHDFGEIDGRLFIDMRLVQGEDLAAVLRRTVRLGPDVAVEILGQIASALDAAHAAGLVHRDVKPSNVLITDLGPDRRPFAYLVDFGLARPVAQDSSELTASGALGTVPYLAPERIVGDSGDQRTDVYALGCVLFEMLSGRKPWTGEMYAVLSGHLKSPPPRVSTEVPGLSPALDQVIATAMAKRPDQRYARAGDLARAARGAAGISTSTPVIGRISQPVTAASTAPPTKPPPGWPPGVPSPYAQPPNRGGKRVVLALVAAVVVVLGVVLGVVALRGDGKPTAQRSSTSGSPPPTTAKPSPSLTAGTGTTGQWSDFASFSRLVGDRAGDTTHSFQGASCSLYAHRADDPSGLVDSVVCGSVTSATSVFVGRFDTSKSANAYQRTLLFTQQASVIAWGANGVARGLAYTSQSTADVPSIDTTICGLPTYVVRFIGQDPAIAAQSLHDQFWSAATFPDLVPPSCSMDLATSSGNAGNTMTASKPTVPFTSDQVSTLLERMDSRQDAYSGSSPSGIETLLSDQSGHLSFWSATSAGLRRTGTGTYPIADPAADYHVYVATVFTGMKHASFVFRGPFTKKGTDQDVVFTYGARGWGPLVARGRTSLVISAFPVTAAAEFAEVTVPGLNTLTTRTTATTTWRWNGTSFVPA